MEAVYVKFFNGFVFRWAFNRFSYLDRLFLTSFIWNVGNKFFSVLVTERHLNIVYIRNFRIKGFVIHLIGGHIGFFAVNFLAVIGYGYSTVIKYTGYVKSEIKSVLTVFHIHCGVNCSVLYLANFTDGVPVLLKLPCFIGGNPGKVGLVIGINTRHKFNIGTVFIGKVTAPHIAEIADSPVPHLFAG